ncbi:MAG: hypothetical protein M0R66_00320 [Candidatus Omnitrophica bacterium]|nr:hypothetical protein [Candidatus Omnitrophota bacterium]
MRRLYKYNKHARRVILAAGRARYGDSSRNYIYLAQRIYRARIGERVVPLALADIPNRRDAYAEHIPRINRPVGTLCGRDERRNYIAKRVANERSRERGVNLFCAIDREYTIAQLIARELRSRCVTAPPPRAP